MSKSKKIDKPIVAASSKEVTPLKDWELKQNEHHIFLIKGEPVTVPAHFIAALKTEKVI